MKPESKRKLLHVVLASYPLLYVRSENFAKLNIAVTTVLLLIWCTSETLRTRFKLKSAPTYILLKNMTRKNADVLSMSFKLPNWLIAYFLLGIIVSSTHFINGVCVLCFGDSAASLLGTRGARKSFQGSLAGFLVAFIFCFIFTRDALLALGASLLGMAVEYLAKGINDNYVVPLGGGVGSYLFSLLRG